MTLPPTRTMRIIAVHGSQVILCAYLGDPRWCYVLHRGPRRRPGNAA